MLQAYDGFWVGVMPRSAELNGPVYAGYAAYANDPTTHRTHLIRGRYENVYIEPALIPAVQPIIRQAERYAAEALARWQEPLAAYFWFNAMRPGDITGMHDHAGTEELLSGVYYVRVPPQSGDLVIETPRGRARVVPQEGMFVFFPTTTRHGVTENVSQHERLSIGLNFSVPG